MKHRWLLIPFFIGLLSIVLVLIAAYLRAGELQPFLLALLFERIPWIGPGLLAVVGGYLFLCAVYYDRFVTRFIFGGMVVFLLAMGIVLNLDTNVRFNPTRLSTNSLISLWEQGHRDTMENYPLFLVLSEHFKDRTLIVAPGMLEELKIYSWQLQAYGRLAEIVTQSYSSELSEEEAQTILRTSPIELKVSILRNDGNQWWTNLEVYIIVTSAPDPASPVYIAKYAGQVFFVPSDFMPNRNPK